VVADILASCEELGLRALGRPRRRLGGGGSIVRNLDFLTAQAPSPSPHQILIPVAQRRLNQLHPFSRPHNLSLDPIGIDLRISNVTRPT
jgi:hypothetical protein